jgi:hypothetical protein
MNHRNSVLETTVLENDDDDDDDDDDSPTTDQYNGTLMVVLGATAALQPTPGMMGYGLSKNAAHYLVQTMGSCTGGVGSQSQYLYTNLKHAHHHPATSTTTTTPGGSGGGGPISNLQDSKLIRQAGRKVRQHVPSLDDLTVIGILPTMLDTPSNRKAHSIPPRPLPQPLQQQRSQSKWKTLNRAVVHHNNNHDKDDDNDDDNDDEDDDGVEENPEIQQLTSTWIRPEHIAQEIGHWIQTPALRPHSGALIKVIPRTTTVTTTTNTTNGRMKKGAQFELVR